MTEENVNENNLEVNNEPVAAPETAPVVENNFQTLEIAGEETNINVENSSEVVVVNEGENSPSVEVATEPTAEVVQDIQPVSEDNQVVINPAIFIDDSNKEEVRVTSSEEPVITKVVDVSNKKKKKLLIIGGAVLVIVVVIILIIVLTGNKKSKSTVNKRVVSNDYSVFVNSVNNSLANGTLDKEINKALKDSKVNTDTLSLLCLDIDMDAEKELVAYVEDKKSKFLLSFEMYDGDVLYEDKIQLNGKDSFVYAYSLNDGDKYWVSDYTSDYTILKHPRRVLKSIDFLNSNYVITKQYKNKLILDNGIEYKPGFKLNALKLEKNEITYEKILKDSSLTEDSIKNMANDYKTARDEETKKQESEQQNREMEANENSIVTNLNGLIIHFGNYHETSAGILGDFVLHQDGSCVLGGNQCSWSYGNYDFGSGTLEQSIDVQRGSELLHFTARGNNTLTNANGWNAIHQN